MRGATRHGSRSTSRSRVARCLRSTSVTNSKCRLVTIDTCSTTWGTPFGKPNSVGAVETGGQPKIIATPLTGRGVKRCVSRVVEVQKNTRQPVRADGCRAALRTSVPALTDERFLRRSAFASHLIRGLVYDHRPRCTWRQPCAWCNPPRCL